VEAKIGTTAVAATLVAAAYSHSQTALTETQLDELEAEVNALLKRTKPSAGVTGLAALMNARRGRYKDAAKGFREIVAADKRNVEAMNNLAYMQVLINAPAEEINPLLTNIQGLVGPTAGL